MLTLTSFPGLPTVRFLIVCSMQNWRGKAWSILSRVNDVSIYLDRERGPRLKEHTHTLWVNLASFPGLPTVQFLTACCMQNKGGRPDPFYHVNDVSVYLGRQRGGVVPDWKNAFHTRSSFWTKNGTFCALQAFELEALSCKFRMFAKWKMYCSWFKKKNACVKYFLSIGDPSPPLST